MRTKTFENTKQSGKEKSVEFWFIEMFVDVAFEKGYVRWLDGWLLLYFLGSFRLLVVYSLSAQVSMFNTEIRRWKTQRTPAHALEKMDKTKDRYFFLYRCFFILSFGFFFGNHFEMWTTSTAIMIPFVGIKTFPFPFSPSWFTIHPDIWISHEWIDSLAEENTTILVTNFCLMSGKLQPFHIDQWWSSDIWKERRRRNLCRDRTIKINQCADFVTYWSSYFVMYHSCDEN